MEIENSLNLFFEELKRFELWRLFCMKFDQTTNKQMFQEKWYSTQKYKKIFHQKSDPFINVLVQFISCSFYQHPFKVFHKVPWVYSFKVYLSSGCVNITGENWNFSFIYFPIHKRVLYILNPIYQMVMLRDSPNLFKSTTYFSTSQRSG